MYIYIYEDSQKTPQKNPGIHRICVCVFTKYEDLQTKSLNDQDSHNTCVSIHRI